MTSDNDIFHLCSIQRHTRGRRRKQSHVKIEVYSCRKRHQKYRRTDQGSDYVHFHTPTQHTELNSRVTEEVFIMVSMVCPRYDCNEIDRTCSRCVSFASMPLFEYEIIVYHCLSARDSLPIECSCLRCPECWIVPGHRTWPWGPEKGEEHVSLLVRSGLHDAQCPWTLDASFSHLSSLADVPMSTTRDMCQWLGPAEISVRHIANLQQWLHSLALWLFSDKKKMPSCTWTFPLSSEDIFFRGLPEG